MQEQRTAVVGGSEEGLVGAKLASMAILGGCALIASLLPVLLTRRCSAAAGFLDHLLRFGGGILLATTFLHLLPEVREGLEEVDPTSWAHHLPVQLPELLMCLGFFLMYGIEEVAHKCLGHKHHKNSEKTPLHQEHDSDPLLNMADIKEEFLRLSEDSANLSTFDSDEDELFTKENPVVFRRKWKPQDELTYSLLPSDVAKSINSENKRSDMESAWSDSTPIRAILITLAISIHQVFEGMAVGLETHISQVWILTGAITAHKAVIAVCVGAEAAQSRPLAIMFLLGSFALATPVGLGLGLALSTDSSLGLFSVLLQGLATGTLLFVVFFEVLQRTQDGPSVLHFVLTAVGFGVMLLLLCFVQG